MCYGPIKEEFKKHFPKNHREDGSLIRILFPGINIIKVN